MSSSKLGKTTSEVEVTNISPHGIWLLVKDEELFLPFDDFPWFQHASVAAIVEVQEESPGHFHWPAIDVDLSLESIRNPKRFPLKFQ
jgi:hypothetical protein